MRFAESDQTVSTLGSSFSVQNSVNGLKLEFINSASSGGGLADFFEFKVRRCASSRFPLKLRVRDHGPARAPWTNPSIRSPAVRWKSLTLDEPNGVLYVPAGNPAPDFGTERRTGDNLYTDSIIAIDATNGLMLGYNQLVKRDNHDRDVSIGAILVTVILVVLAFGSAKVLAGALTVGGLVAFYAYGTCVFDPISSAM